MQFCRNVGTSVTCTALAVLAVVGSAAADTQKSQSKSSATQFSDPVSRDKAASAAMRDMLAIEMEDRYVASHGGFVPRDPAECGSVVANCQDWTRTVATGGRSSDLVGIAALNGDDFKCADSFTITAPQTLTNICFDGFYVSTTNAAGAGGAPLAGAEAFRIRVYGNTGSPNSGIPNSANILKEWTVGANAGYSLTVDPNTTLTRVTGATRPGVFAWQVALSGTSQLALTPGCYWLEVVGATNGIPEGARLRWAIVNGASPANDGVCYQALNSTAFSYVDLIGGTVTATDMAFCLNFALNSNASCAIPPAPTNLTCAAAQVVTAPFTATNVSTLRAQTTATPFCGRNPVNGNTLWYKIAGDGNTFTVDTCGANTNFDTVINVYCGTCAALNCIANNDTGPATCLGNGASDPSLVSFPTVTGTDYFVAVYGFELDAGFLDVAITSAAGTPASACVSDRCPVDISLVANVEADACGASTNSAAICNAGTGGSFTLGVPFAGTSYNLGTNRDFDFWECASTLPDNSGGNGSCFLEVSYQVEFPGLFNFFTGACAANNGTFIPTAGAVADYLGNAQCPRTYAPVNVTTPAGQPFRINLLPVDFGGVPCAAGNNNYIITVTLAATGSCCQPNTNCQVTTQASCALQAGFVFTANGTCSPVDACSGVCCTGTACAAAAATDCVGAGTTFFAGGTCTPTPCVTPGVCCRGATCNTTITTAGACTATGTAGSFFATGGSVCNVGNVSSAPCCYADYNKTGGVTVNDIFNFLSDWFAASPFARTGGNGDATPLTVQNIFDFLTNWFNGCN